jgi:hypothetical protein
MRVMSTTMKRMLLHLEKTIHWVQMISTLLERGSAIEEKNECFGILTRHKDHNRVVGQFCNLVTNLEPPRENSFFLRWARCSAVVSNEGETRLLRKT